MAFTELRINFNEIYNNIRIFSLEKAVETTDQKKRKEDEKTPHA
jgi:hypothetical protein